MEKIEPEEKDMLTLLKELKEYEYKLIRHNEQLKEKNKIIEDLRKEYYVLFEFAPIGYFIFDKDFYILRVNSKASILLDMEKVKLLTTKFKNNIDLDYHKELERHRQDIIKNNMDTIQIKLKNNLWVNLKSVMIIDAIGHHKIISAATDITDLYTALKNEEYIKEQYENIFDNISDAIALHRVIYDDYNNPIDYYYMSVNKAFEELFNVDRDNLKYNKVNNIFPNMEYEFLDIYFDAIRKNESRRFQSYTNVIHKHINIYLFIPQKGYFTTIIRDIDNLRDIKESLLAIGNLVNLFEYKEEVEVIQKGIDKIIGKL